MAMSTMSNEGMRMRMRDEGEGAYHFHFFWSGNVVVVGSDTVTNVSPRGVPTLLYARMRNK